MPKKKCAFGFSCASMMQQPGLIAEDCPNRDTCGTIAHLTEEEEVELLRNEQERLERIRVNQRQAARLMLMARACPQSVESLGITQALANINERLTRLNEQLDEYGNVYIAPPKCEAHEYNVKRPWGVYTYNKLTAESPIFEPAEQPRKVRVVHLSHNYDARNLEARAGIERRNKLLSLRTRLAYIEQELTLVLAEM